MTGFAAALQHSARGSRAMGWMRSTRLAPFALAVLVAGAGCGGEVGSTDAVAVRDSAGISIVTNPDAALPEWSVDPAPRVDIGSAEGADGQDLALPWSSIRMPDGRIAISNARTNELRFFDPAGAWSGSSGGGGEGPGEFGIIASIHRGPGDTIVASDARLPRLNLFAPSGEFARMITLDLLEERPPRLRGLLNDTVGLFRVTFFERSGGVSAPVRDTMLLALRPLDGGENRLLGRFPAAERFHQAVAGGATVGWNAPFQRNLYTAVSEDVVWVGRSDRYEIRGYDAEGELTRIIRVDGPAAPVTDEDRRRFFEHELSDVQDPDQRRTYQEAHELMEFPPTMPAFSALEADAAGNLWVQEYALPWSGEPAVWRVFDPSGRATALVRLPPGLVVHEIGEDYVMGLWRDGLDVEHIRIHRLERGGP